MRCYEFLSDESLSRDLIVTSLVVKLIDTWSLDTVVNCQLVGIGEKLNTYIHYFCYTCTCIHTSNILTSFLFLNSLSSQCDLPFDIGIVAITILLGDWNVL